MKDKEIKNNEMTKESHTGLMTNGMSNALYTLFILFAPHYFCQTFFIINTWFLVLIPGLGSTLFTDL